MFGIEHVMQLITVGILLIYIASFVQQCHFQIKSKGNKIIVHVKIRILAVLLPITWDLQLLMKLTFNRLTVFSSRVLDSYIF